MGRGEPVAGPYSRLQYKRPKLRGLALWLQCPVMTERRNTPSRRRWSGLIWLLAFVVFAALAVSLTLYGARDEPVALRQSESLPPTQDADADDSHSDFAFGRGYSGADWQLYFTEPAGKSSKESYRGGIDARLAADIAKTRHTLDIAVYELDSPTLTAAILKAHNRGVTVRIVADNEHGLHSQDNPQLRDLQAAGLPIVDDARSAFMHNKFMILDGRRVWTGSMNYTVNGAYRHNNNAFVMDGAHAAAAYQAEFDEMFLRGEFGAGSTDDGVVTFDLGDGSASVVFGPEADELPILLAEIGAARQSIRFMVFAFSLDALSRSMLRAAAEHDVSVRGIFDKRSSLANWSQLPALHCAGMGARQDGNYYSLHHKVIIIDERVVISGSFNFSKAAVQRNDENLVIIREPRIAALYIDEWQRLWDGALPIADSAVDCG